MDKILSICLMYLSMPVDVLLDEAFRTRWPLLESGVLDFLDILSLLAIVVVSLFAVFQRLNSSESMVIGSEETTCLNFSLSRLWLLPYLVPFESSILNPLLMFL